METSNRNRLLVGVIAAGAIISVGILFFLINSVANSKSCAMTPTKPTINDSKMQTFFTEDLTVSISFMGYLQYVNQTTGQPEPLYLPLEPRSLTRVQQPKTLSPAKYSDVVKLEADCGEFVFYFMDEKLHYLLQVDVSPRAWPDGDKSICTINHEQIRTGVGDHKCVYPIKSASEGKLKSNFYGYFTYKFM